MEFYKGTVGVGNTLSHGSYEQDDNTINGVAPIEWLVLDLSDDKAPLIGKNVHDCQ